HGRTLTAATLCSQAALSVVFLVAVRAVGIGPAQAPTVTLLALFALSRAASLVPSTPGGVGVVEVTMTALLSTSGAGGARWAAAVLRHRARTYALPRVLGGPALAAWATFGRHVLLPPAAPAEADDREVPLVVDLDGTFFPVTTRTLMLGRLAWTGRS